MMFEILPPEEIEKIVVKRFPSRQKLIREIGLDETLIDVAEASAVYILRQIIEWLEKYKSNTDGYVLISFGNAELQALKKQLEVLNDQQD